MNYNLDQIKLGLVKPLVQVTLFQVDGWLVQSCNTLIDLNRKESLYDRFDFLASMEDYFHEMPIGEELRLNPMEWHEDIHGLFVVRLAKIDAETIQWILFDKSVEEERTKSVLASRDRAVVNEEYLRLEKDLLASKKALLEYKNEELLRLQKFKERFFATISHEMRTPLNSITGLVKLLEWSDPKEIYNYLHALKSTSEHLNSIINDVLDLSKIEENKLLLEDVSFDLKQLVNTVAKGFSFIVKEKKIDLKVSLSEDLPTFINADPTRMSQVLYNIISNALKFTEKGSVSVGLSVQNERLCFEIKDTGIGMKPESIQNILEPYVQAAGQSYRSFKGTGLGMTIANELIKIMGGSLEIKSALGKGTNMTFDLPYLPADHAEVSVDDHYDPTANVDVSQFAFLFAEDDAISTMVMKERSAKWHLNSTFVATAQALRRELNEGQYDILITDLHLEDDYAPDLLYALRASEGANRSIPIIFLSGDPLHQHEEKLMGLDNWAYLVKPVNPRELSLKIRQLLNISADNTLPAVDLTVLGNAAGHDEAFMKELIETILITMPDELEKLRLLVNKNDTQEAAKILHKIKPSVSYFGISQLVEERAALYDRAKKGEDISKDLVQFMTRINIALESLAAKKLKL